MQITALPAPAAFFAIASPLAGQGEAFGERKGGGIPGGSDPLGLDAGRHQLVACSSTTPT